MAEWSILIFCRIINFAKELSFAISFIYKKTAAIHWNMTNIIKFFFIEMRPYFPDLLKHALPLFSRFRIRLRIFLYTLHSVDFQLLLFFFFSSHPKKSSFFILFYFQLLNWTDWVFFNNNNNKTWGAMACTWIHEK